MNPRGKTQILFWMGVLLSITACAGTRSSITPTPEAIGANSIVISTFTAAPIDSPRPVDTSTPALESSPEATAMGQLPGLSPRTVTVSLEQEQFTCTTVRKGAIYYERSCTRGVPSVEVFHIVISGREPFFVDFIEASVLQYENPDPEKTIAILSLIASLPYDGATPAEAQSWVESTVPILSDGPGDVQENVFGGVKYVLRGPPTTITFQMGNLP